MAIKISRTVMMALIALAAVVAGSASAQAQSIDGDVSSVQTSPAAPALSLSMAGATDYIFRGVSQTQNDPAIFGAANVSYNHFYVAGGAENVDFNNGIDTEYDLSAGWASSLSGFDLDLGAIRYGYLGMQDGASIDTVELRGAASHLIGPIRVGGAINHAFDYFGTRRPAIYFEDYAAYAVAPEMTVSAALGRQQITAGNSYITWDAGADYTLGQHIAVGLHYIDTDAHSKLYHSHFVASVTAGL